MRPPRIAILVLFFTASLFIFCRSLTSIARSTTVISQPATRDSRFSSLFYFSPPFTLFPPNAAISLTDDNSTSFPARPAAFGPILPSKGLSGQLWIGSGFADDNLQEGEGEGELGCSDIPGWEDGKSNAALKGSSKLLLKSSAVTSGAARKADHPKREPDKSPLDRTAAPDKETSTKSHPVDDGTDDYLHQELTNLPKSQHDATGPSGGSHADIQSLQEAAEIAGKIVLLSRGGCGFLEKVKWAQRRGAKALIVGDNRKGGPLIQMFARGDISSVTIPSVFTARTTAHLLSSLTQPGSFIEDTIDENGRPTLKVQQSDKARKNKKIKQQGAPVAGGPTTKPAAESKIIKSPPTKKSVVETPSVPRSQSGGWLSRLFHWGRHPGSVEERSRPPSSGRFDWVLVDDWNDESDKMLKDSLGKSKEQKPETPKSDSSTDDFVIGVQDWRDPDLVGSSDEAEKTSIGGGMRGGEPKDNAPKGGIITPGSGEYKPKDGTVNKDKSQTSGSGDNGLISKIFGDDEGTDSQGDPPLYRDATAQNSEDAQPPSEDDPEEREGLWVTITPTSSAGSFLDALLVLVISPLITLSVVYGLLILRAHIRRRQWRAPKYLVERLPVRTYYAVAGSPSHSPRLPSPTSSSPTTPLLQTSPTRPRPRSRTTTAVPHSASFLTVGSSLQTPRSPSRPEHEKASGSLSSEWKKYMGRQVECVVCLEEYVDGVSRVMSLPCGHEFHADCITPWLTTRRRTCPICKGDVVRSLARGSPSSPRYESPNDDSDEMADDMEAGGSGAGSEDRDSDVEQGFGSSPPRRSPRSNRGGGWMGILSNSLGGTSRTSRHGGNSEDDHSR